MIDAGTLKPRRTADIAASPISIGFETLDRYHFDPKRTYPHLAELGAKWARVQTGWNRCEREKGVYDFGWLDAIVDDLLAIGVQPFFNLGFGNLLTHRMRRTIRHAAMSPSITGRMQRRHGAITSMH